MEEKNQAVDHQKLSSNWRQDGADFICDLGSMKKAIIVRRFTNDIHLMNTYYAIAQASYFPFTDEQYNTRFNNSQDACMLGENHIINWFNSIIIKSKSDNNKNQLNESNKQIEG